MSGNSHKVIDTNHKIRRFERSEIILHWVNAVPFLILFITGALNIISRFEIYPLPFIGAIRLIHKIASVLWLAGIGYAFFFVGRELNMANTRDQFKLSVSDLTWAVKTIQSMFNRHVEVPPVGKFNIGQKFNALLVILYAVAFAGSGALIWAYNTMLFPWYFHASLFFMTVFSLGGHLYLSFVHPSTRPGLIGIFNGMVPRSYIVHHHGLMIRDTPNAARARAERRVVAKPEQPHERESRWVAEFQQVLRTQDHQGSASRHVEGISAGRSRHAEAEAHADPDARLVAAWYGGPGCSDDEGDAQKAWNDFGGIKLSRHRN